MAIFRPDENERVCELNFDEKFFYEIPLNEKMAQKLADICEKNKNALEKLATDDSKAFDKAFDMCLDAIDELLGDGAADDIMSTYKREPGFIDIAKVINYIASEYKQAYNAEFDKLKATGELPGENRAARRARRGNR